MGAGSTAAGIGPAGFDPTEPAPPQPTFAQPLAARFDLAARGYPLTTDGTGRLQAVHPVDHQVELALGVERGSIPSCPDLGLDRGRIRRARGNNVTAEVNVAVNEALRDLLQRGDIALRSVDVRRTDFGRLYVAVNYVNQRLPTPTNSRLLGVYA